MAGGETGVEPTLQIFLDEDEYEEANSIAVDDFVRWFTKTSDQFLRRRLRAQRSYLDVPMEENEPLEIDGLTGWRMKVAMLQHSHEIDEQIAAWRQEGMVPAGELGDTAIANQLGGIEEILRSIPEAQPLEIAVTSGGMMIHGNVPVAEIDEVQTALIVDPSDGKATMQLTAWIYSLLASNQLGHPVAGRLYGLKKGQSGSRLETVVYSFDGGEHFEKHLGELVELFRAAQRAPLPHFPKTAEAYTGVKPKQDEGEDATEERRRTAALNAWETSDYSTGESEDEAIRLFFNTSDPISEGFLSITRAIWGPLVSGRTKVDTK